LYEPLGLDGDGEDPSPTHVRTPEGIELALESEELQNSIAQRLGSSVELMKLKHGTFDEASVSVINLATISAIGREAGEDLDTRRFRANIVIATDATEPFLEDSWIGGRLVFGTGDPGPAVNITMPDKRCMMVNLDPDTAKQEPRIMKTVVLMNKNNAGAYGTVGRTGQLRVGQPVRRAVEAGNPCAAMFQATRVRSGHFRKTGGCSSKPLWRER
jgi:hypothetical protein